MLSQLIYVSTRNINCTDKEIKNILEDSQKKNEDKEITGVLLYSEKQFLQVVEGGQKEVIALYNVIKTDNRHSNVIMVSLSPIMERTFPSWQMGSKDIGGENYELVSKTNENEAKEFNELLKGNKSKTNAIKLIEKLFL